LLNSSGDEGGEIFLNKSTTNTTIITGITLDVYQNKVRLFETGGTNRGGYWDISTLGAGVSTNLNGNGNAIVDNFYYSISNSIDTRPIFEDTNVLFNWDETSNQLEFQMKLAQVEVVI
jgi:hypothetical protein